MRILGKRFTNIRFKIENMQTLSKCMVNKEHILTAMKQNSIARCKQLVSMANRKKHTRIKSNQKHERNCDSKLVRISSQHCLSIIINKRSKHYQINEESNRSE